MLTDHQRSALRYDRHLTVTANAGSGKTTVLVQRFVGILAETDTPIDRLAAITFTDKAAGELRRKIAAAIEERRKGAGGGPASVRLAGARDRLASATIGTIHSFCAGILREFPVEAEIDAAFTVLEEVDRRMLEDQAIREAIESVLQPDDPAGVRTAFLDCLASYGRRATGKALSSLLHKREIVERLTRPGGALDPAAPAAAILTGWDEQVGGWIAGEIERAGWGRMIRELLAGADGREAEELRDLAAGAWEQKSLRERIAAYLEIMGRVLTKEGALRKSAVKGPLPDGRAGERLKKLAVLHDSIGRVAESFVRDSGGAGNAALLARVRAVIAVFTTAEAAFEEKKAELGKLDFEDLQLKTARLLKREEIRRALSERYRYIMVDEYQDTNRLQYEILRLLVRDFSEGNVFVVGDPKQSIYGFRDAEVEVFEETKKTMSGAPAAGAPARSEHIVLSESFRPLIGPVAFVNTVFSGGVEPGGRGFDVPFDELVKGRANDAQGRIELLLTGGGEEEAGRGGVEEECRLVAWRLRELSSAGYPVFDPRSEAARPFRYSDAAVLLRSRTHVQTLERALETHGVPYRVSGGIGFYQTQELIDFRNAFRFFLNPSDDVALAGLLRSPFFAVSDAELFAMTRRRRDGSLWMAAIAYAGGRKASARMKRGIMILREALALAGRLSVPALVRLLFMQTGWHGTAAALPSGAQRVANVRKLIRFAREFEARGLTTLYDFVERLDVLVDEEEREGQARIESGGNHVNILTIHAAKGLEFPVVCIPFAHARFRSPGFPAVDAGYGIALPAEDEESEGAMVSFLRRRARMKSLSEEKRVFYVACTRARDMLIISGDAGKVKRDPSFLKWTLDGLGLSPAPGAAAPAGAASISAGVRVLQRKGNEFTESVSRVVVPVGLAVPAPPAPPEAVRSPAAGPVRRLRVDIAPVAGRTQGEFFSATQIRTYRECPRKYYLKYVLGLPESHSVPSAGREEDDPDDEITAEREGLAVHRVLQQLRAQPVDDGEIRRMAARAAGGMLDAGETLIRAVTAHALAFTHSPFGAEVLASAETKTEWTIDAVFGGDYLTGTLDRVYLNAAGERCVVDYKTDAVGPDEIGGRAALYLPQLSFYAFLLHRLFGQAEVPASLVFLRHPYAPLHTRFTGADLEGIGRELTETIASIKAGSFSGGPDPCASCTYSAGGRCLLRPGAAPVHTPG